MTHFWNFGTALISLELFKLDTSHFTWSTKNVSTNEKNAKLGQKRSCGGHVTLIWNSGNPLLSWERLKLETSNLARRLTALSTNEKMQNKVTRYHAEAR